MKLRMNYLAMIIAFEQIVILVVRFLFEEARSAQVYVTGGALPTKTSDLLLLRITSSAAYFRMTTNNHRVINNLQGKDIR